MAQVRSKNGQCILNSETTFINILLVCVLFVKLTESIVKISLSYPKKLFLIASFTGKAVKPQVKQKCHPYIRLENCLAVVTKGTVLYMISDST